MLRFEPDGDGRAVPEVQLAIVDHGGNVATPGTRASYTADAGDAANMTVLANALGLVLDVFGSDETSPWCRYTQSRLATADPEGNCGRIPSE